MTHGHLNRSALTFVMLLMTATLAGCAAPHPAPAKHPASPLAKYEEAAIPPGEAGKQIRLGRQIFDETPKYARAYVGNQLSCSDCHVHSGLASYSAPMIDLANIFPRYNKRAGRVISLQERFIECFTRSENGVPPPKDGNVIQNLTAYVNWLSRDGVKGKAYPARGLVKLPELTGNISTGKSIYLKQCADCHGKDGAGVPPVLPPLWGDSAYNDGAGMDNVKKMAAFVIHNMPQNNPGTLTPQDAYDVSAYIHRMPRPKFNPAYKGY
ncbi:MAG TPA: c-type cytochrome [Acidobacteriaceae bacterium]|nr:c-type cytochrome [Acidobacteriaceae bacterium]